MFVHEPNDVFDRRQLWLQVVTQFPQPSRNLISFAAGELMIVVCCDEYRDASILNVSEWESHRNGRRQNSWFFFESMHSLHQRLHRFAQGTLHRRHGHEWQLPILLHRSDFSANHSRQQFGGFSPALVHVDVRIGIEANDRIRQSGHAEGDVGVQVECDDDRHVVTNNTSNDFDERALGIFMLLGNHCSVQVE